MTNLGVSSIGWEPDEDLEVAGVLARFGISNVDLTPSKYFPWGAENAVVLAKERREFWQSRGFKVRGVQSILFGAPNWNILNTDHWNNLLEHFEKVFNVTEALGAKYLVFGSPGNRKLEGRTKKDAIALAEEFFGQLAEMMHGRNLMVTIEANPERYGCDFLTTTFDAADLVRRIDSPNISGQLDLGTCLINSENLQDLQIFSRRLSYVHLSTLDLKPLHIENNDLIKSYLAAPFAGTMYTIEQKSEPGMGGVTIADTIEWLLEVTNGKQEGLN